MYKGAVGIVLVRALGTEQRKCEKRGADLLLTVRLTVRKCGKIYPSGVFHFRLFCQKKL